jgi:hypothetical protein
MRYAVCGMRYAVCGMRYAVCGMRYAVCGMRYAVCEKTKLAIGNQFLRSKLVGNFYFSFSSLRLRVWDLRFHLLRFEI